MRFISLGSGSRGNSTLLQLENQYILIDCGFSYKKLLQRLESIALSPDCIGGIFVTHEHKDHSSGIRVFQKRHPETPIFLTYGTFRALKNLSKDSIHFIYDSQWVELMDFSILPVTVPHDALEPVQYIVKTNHLTFGILTDVGHVTQHILDHYQCCDVCLVEANYDEVLLENGDYPPRLKKRIASRWGHLSNQQMYRLTSYLFENRCAYMIVGHMSDENNSLDRIQKLLEPYANQVSYIHQEVVSDWIDCLSYVRKVVYV